MIRRHLSVELRDPVLIAAFHGWNDAGDAATFAAGHLARVWSAKRIASIDPEEFYDFQATRPQVELVDGITRRIAWPQNDFTAAVLQGMDRDVVLLIGTEPNIRWGTFTKLVVEVAKEHGVTLAITLGALLADVPHSRPVHITGTAVDQELIQKLGLVRSRYEGPTGIVGVLHDAFSSASIQSASLWAAVPHYLAVSPNPKAALALVRKATELIGASADCDALAHATKVYEKKVQALVDGDEDIQTYVRLLEKRSDEQSEDAIDQQEIPSGDALAAELERYLRDQGNA